MLTASVCWIPVFPDDFNFAFSCQTQNLNDTLTGRKTTSHRVLMVAAVYATDVQETGEGALNL